MAFMHRKNIDLASIVGILMAFAALLLAILLGGDFLHFIDFQSILIVVFGTFFITMACYTFEEIKHTRKIILKALYHEPNHVENIAYWCIKSAERAYKTNIISLVDREDEIRRVSEFFFEGIRLINDNISIEFLEHNMTQHIVFMVERHKKAISMLKKAGEVAPAMGLIGTLIGLVQMFGNLHDVSKIGPAMAVALLTTFYGAIISYVVMFPLASKLERNTDEELLLSKIYFETLLSISKRQNPRLLEVTINSLLPINKHIKYFEV